MSGKFCVFGTVERFSQRCDDNDCVHFSIQVESNALPATRIALASPSLLENNSNSSFLMLASLWTERCWADDVMESETILTPPSPTDSAEPLEAELQQPWTCTKENILTAPYDYLDGQPGKNLRSQLMLAFNTFLDVPPNKFAVVTKVVTMLHTASLLWVEALPFAEVILTSQKSRRYWGCLWTTQRCPSRTQYLWCSSYFEQCQLHLF